MTTPVRQSTGSDEDDDDMNIDEGQELPHLTVEQNTTSGSQGALATVLRDATNWLPQVKSLKETDVIILLTPVTIPISSDPTDTSDPFEPLGRSLAKRHSRIRHVPYTQRNGITSTHLGFIKRGHVIILCFALRPGQHIQLEFADIALAVSDNKPCIIVVCCTPIDANQVIPFPTVIQTAGYTPPALESTAALIFGEQQSAFQSDPSPAAHFTDPQRPRLWPVELWNEVRDVSSVLELWNESINGRFSLDQTTLASLLRRPGYAKHYVVRDTKNGVILGICATYLSYVDKEGEKLIASIAALLVRSTHRHLGIGLSLHSHAVSQLKKTRGVIRLQFGSTFPRILYGPPSDMNFNEEWFRRRGWHLDKDVPGQGQAIYDLILDFKDWKYGKNISPMQLQFRLCAQEDMMRVLDLVEGSSARRGKMGWFDQYSSLMNGPNVKDIVIALENDNIVATALTYTPSCGSPIPSNLPWAAQISPDIGGVTCICLPIENNTVMVGLLDACIKNLQNQGMKRMFIDGISSELDALKQLGFLEWAKYKDVWKDT
ncbi:hypothetical protein LHYA1_G002266 [Lachnellula hyalina]|uniref:N-acetyltransferase domain-containing protein n=1 Tax=Lachnellula hyalina TaxID=1316788 RepID=A0A8H8R5R6_9HELO|nr:uncharacterized protein LHYA1_G002266 [Lachnellula hyalina]TVY29038.1 hypothetical protein LHYA1_G002266 [Lachnellula hyalina]